MAVVATVGGVKIHFYWDEHPPPHFHAEYAEHVAVIEVRTLEMVAGYIPRPQYRRVVAWARPRFASLMLAWDMCAADEHPGRIQ